MQQISRSVHVIDHPVTTDALAHLRNVQTDTTRFRYYSDRLCTVVMGEAIRGLGFTESVIATPLTETTVQTLSDEIVVIPVLRAGLAMLSAALQLLPGSSFGFAGLARDEKTAIAREYYWKLPHIGPDTVVLMVDPMLATGGSICHALSKIVQLKPQAIRIASVLAAPEGLERVLQEYPEIEIYTAAIDDHLNEQKYIVPGLGDYGDRYFGTV